MPAPTSEQLLIEVDDLLRTMPVLSAIRDESPGNSAWLGRASAVLTYWSLPRSVTCASYVRDLQASRTVDPGPPYRGLAALLHEAQHALRLSTGGPLTVAIAAGKPFQYFDEIRQIVEGARVEVFFVDPYLDGEFVSRYLPNVAQGVLIRLLAREKLATLLPAVQLYRQQAATNIEVRSVGGFHDRYLFVDRSACYHSGASFKDGAKTAPTTLTQVADAFAPVLAMYEQLWSKAQVHP